MFVCCVLSGRGLCDELITRPEESYRMWRVVVCDHKKSPGRGGHSPRWAAEPERERERERETISCYKSVKLMQVFRPLLFPDNY
jgi:hypothetical protein